MPFYKTYKKPYKKKPYYGKKYTYNPYKAASKPKPKKAARGTPAPRRPHMNPRFDTLLRQSTIRGGAGVAQQSMVSRPSTGRQPLFQDSYSPLLRGINHAYVNKWDEPIRESVAELGWTAARVATTAVARKVVSAAAKYFGKLVGLGDYVQPGFRVSRNSLVNSSSPPVVRNRSAIQEFTFIHREYIKDIVTAGTPNTFKSESFDLNPGRSNVFPWLAAIAAGFQEYRLDGVVFEFKSMSGNALNSVNTALGQVIMASNYDVMRAPFQNKYQMENSEFASSCKPSQSMLHPIECSRSQSVMNELYVATHGVIPTNAIPQMYDFCKFQIATNGMQGTNVNVGELWVTYQITFFKPIANSGNVTQIDPAEDPTHHINPTVYISDLGPCRSYSLPRSSGTIHTSVASASPEPDFPEGCYYGDLFKTVTDCYPWIQSSTPGWSVLANSDLKPKDENVWSYDNAFQGYIPKWTPGAACYVSPGGITFARYDAQPNRLYICAVSGDPYRPAVISLPPEWHKAVWMMDLDFTPNVYRYSAGTPLAKMVCTPGNGLRYATWNESRTQVGTANDPYPQTVALYDPPETDIPDLAGPNGGMFQTIPTGTNAPNGLTTSLVLAYDPTAAQASLLPYIEFPSFLPAFSSVAAVPDNTFTLWQFAYNLGASFGVQLVRTRALPASSADVVAP